MTPAVDDDPLQRLLARELFGIKLGLHNIAALSAALGHPELASRSVIVAGTNGKGSVAAMVSAALTAAGHRTGRYTSPHLVRLEERFAIDGEGIATPQLRDALREVFDAEAACRADGRLTVPATFFELATAAAFVVFARERVDVTVLEVGLGGRHDATNVASPIAGAITTVDLDHTAHLGSTIAEIAREKAGIVKAGMTVVHGEHKADAVAEFQAAADRVGGRLVDARAGSEVRVAVQGERTVVDLRTPQRAYDGVALALQGRHQAANALVAVRLLEILDGLGTRVGADAIRDGLGRARWPGRLDTVAVAGGRRVLLDAAHNPAGAATLAAYLEDTGRRGVPVVFGAMRDKDAAAMLSILAPVTNRFVFTRPAMERATPPADLAALCSAACPGVPYATAERATDALAEALATSDFVVVAGSIFLVGEVMAALSPAGDEAAAGA